MELEIIKQSLTKAISSHRKLLPLTSRDLDLNELTTENTLTFSNSTGGFSTFYENWEDFLNGIDKFWNLLNAYKLHYVSEVKSKTLIDWLATLNSQRTTDDLLKYLDKARNNSHHTLWRHLKESSPFEVISGYGSTITFLPNGIQVTGEGDSAKEVHVLFKPGLILLNTVKVIEKKKEVIYELPVNHLGIPLKPMERIIPQIVAQKGLLFYKQVFEHFCALI